VALFGAFPLWWILGLAVFAPLIFAIPMAHYLLRLRHVAVPRGFSLWLLFIVWVAAGVTALWLQPSGTAPVAGLGRLVPFGYRIIWYLAVTIVLLYVGNLPRRDFPDVRIYRLLALLFLVTIVGGYIGVLLPNLSVSSVLELVVPPGLRSNAFLSILIHPVIAQVMDIGVVVTRPAAPFIYANDWGANAGLLLPFFFLAWTGKEAGWRRRAFPFVAVASVPPLIFSLNRGLWLGLGVTAVFVAVRLALAGRLAALAGVLAMFALVGVMIPTTPLGGLVSERLANQHSNEGRGELALRAVEVAWHESPVIGFGNSREVAGNFFSIAGGRTAECPSCAPPQIGTQGHLWLLVFGHGFGGALLCVAFFIRRFMAAVRSSARDDVAICAVVVYFFSVIFVYDLLTMSSVILMIALGVAWRRERDRESGALA
jgi:hypothetical protein